MNAMLLEQFNEITIQQIKIKRCHYYPERWQQELFKIYQITMPTQLKNAVPKRLTEFVAGRVLAKQLLAEYSCTQSVDILQDRSPAWPAGFVGSITHAKGIAACAVLPITQANSLGLDLECWLTPEVASQIQPNICLAEELNNVNVDFSFTKKVTLIFSAKETLYKMLYPKAKQFFDFTDAKIINQQGDNRSGVLEIQLLKNLTLNYLENDNFLINYICNEHSCLTLSVLY